MFGERLPVELKVKISNLASVDVNEMSKYTLDSLSRREDYDYIFKGKNDKPLWDNKLSGDGRKPAYEYCVHATSMDILLYINDKLILFKKGKPNK